MTSIARDLATLTKEKTSFKRTAFVPTMGALHQGHLSLIDLAKQHADHVIVSIFVNPTQFAAHEDFGTYPRTEAHDVALLKEKHVDLIYIPQLSEIYPDGAKQTIDVGSIGSILEGVARPHFFNGVATVVRILFEHVQPDVAVFGEKDYQQLTMIRQLINTLKLPIKIIGGPIKRDALGLALSSRNQYLSQKSLRQASLIYETLTSTKRRLEQGSNIDQALQEGIVKLTQPFVQKVDYFSLCDADSLKPITSNQHDHARLLTAVSIDGVRLIDNIDVHLPSFK